MGKFIKSVDKKFKLELTANDEKINMDPKGLELAIVNHFFREGRFEIGEQFAQVCLKSKLHAYRYIKAQIRKPK